MNTVTVYNAMQKQALSAAGVKNGLKWIVPVVKHVAGKAGDKIDDAARVIGKPFVRGRHLTNAADDAARTAQKLSENYKAFGYGSDIDNAATAASNKFRSAARRQREAKSTLEGAKNTLANTRSQAEYADALLAQQAAEKGVDEAAKGFKGAKKEMDAANAAKSKFHASAGGKEQARLKRQHFSGRADNQALYDRYGGLITNEQERAGKAIMGGATAGVITAGTGALLESSNKPTTDGKPTAKAPAKTKNEELRKELPQAKSDAPKSESKQETKSDSKKSEPAKSEATAAPAPKQNAAPEGRTEEVTDPNYNHGGSDNATTTEPPKAKGGINPEWAGLGAGALGATGIYAGLGLIPAIRRRRILRAIAALAGGAGIGYGAYSLAQPKTASYKEFKTWK